MSDPRQIEQPARMRILALSATVFLGLAGATHAQSDADTHPINCATAEGDIRAMNAEIKHAQDQKLRNIAAIAPAGALLGIIKGDENERLQMLSGEYEKKLNARIAATKAQCHIQSE
jgi:hypothetical protein